MSDYVKYLDFSFGTWERAYLIRFDEKYAYICDTFSFDWLCRINKTGWIEEMDTNRINKTFFKHEFISYEERLFDDFHLGFPLRKYHMCDFSGISEFFKKLQFSNQRAFFDAVCNTLERTHFLMSKKTIKDVIDYCSRHAPKDDRIAFLVSDECLKYVKE